MKKEKLKNILVRDVAIMSMSNMLMYKYGIVSRNVYEGTQEIINAILM